MPVIALQGIRGGVGTTAVVSGLAWALQNAGHSVLVIDFALTNLLRMYFNMPFVSPYGWARAWHDNLSLSEQTIYYTSLLDIIPFGLISDEEQLVLDKNVEVVIQFWQAQLEQWQAVKKYDFILLDLPDVSSQLVSNVRVLAEIWVCVLNTELSCHLRLHQQKVPQPCYFLVNKYSSTSQLQRELSQLWLYTVPNLLPLFIHRDEAIAEALAMKKPIGEYGFDSLATQEFAALAQWCSKNLTEQKS